ncbi:hypothetical protein ROJ8625_00134 [Roseivivax jejudonensis]|uniref:Uncharacterized protein n=1 Tax=Roseivivax jejudonensis TaxID=1529041 RepID=A0A1X6Y4A7_9RHOB|nr:hypothetical protein [Roseivivax jejudonensis]SLN09974.1 hypothetical protein ROJ8625_00134 [Roseivivax jejudonensis]
MPKPSVPEKFRPGYIGEMDRRTKLGAIMQARWQEVTEDLGGPDRLSYAQRSLIERALWLEYWLQAQEASLGEGRIQDFDPGQWVQAANSLQGIFSRLGLERRSRDVKDITDYLDSKARRGRSQKVAHG